MELNGQDLCGQNRSLTPRHTVVNATLTLTYQVTNNSTDMKTSNH